jgi:anti-sigma28 factor (negative regulator of flagellin synthesis)
MDHLDNPSTRKPVFANARDLAEPFPSLGPPLEVSKKAEESAAQQGGQQPGEAPSRSIWSVSEATAPDLEAASASTAIEGAREVPATPALDNLIDDATGEARMEKVAKIKKSLADGTYNVSAEDLARKLIEHMLEP